MRTIAVRIPPTPVRTASPRLGRLAGRVRGFLFPALSFSLSVSAAACGSGSGGAPRDGTGSLFPLAVGNRWAYQVTGSKGPEPEKTQVVTSTAAASERAALRLTTTQGVKVVTSIQYLDGDLLFRASEETAKAGILQERVRFVPPQLRVDTALTRLGATYSSEHVEEHIDANGGIVAPAVSKKHVFTVEAVDETVVVPAGTFRAVRIRRDTEGGPAKTYWYARGFGKIREIGGQTEELVRIDLIPTEEGGAP